MKTIITSGMVLSLMTVAASGQSAVLMDEILAEERLSYGSAAYLVLGVTGRIDEGASRAEAVERLEELEAAIPETSIDAPITLGELSLLVMQVFEIDGGIMYTLLQDPRYATRELEFREVIQGDAFPRMQLDGERGLRIINRAAALREEGAL